MLETYNMLSYKLNSFFKNQNIYYVICIINYILLQNNTYKKEKEVNINDVYV